MKLLGSRTGLPRKEQILVTDRNAGALCLLNLSGDVQTLSVTHVISGTTLNISKDIYISVMTLLLLQLEL